MNRHARWQMPYPSPLWARNRMHEQYSETPYHRYFEAGSAREPGREPWEQSAPGDRSAPDHRRLGTASV